MDMQQQPNKKLAVYTITEQRNSDKSVWTKVGAAFRNRDGSYNLHLDALPLAGKLHMREVDDRAFRRGELEREEVAP